jgi:ubiquinone/menaquinone biosynthesis C-methylase UbiE
MSTFIGVDIASMFPNEKVKPANAGFLQCNVVDGLPFPNATFEFVRQGFMMIAIPEHDWHEMVLTEMIRVTKPGGYIEIMVCL